MLIAIYKNGAVAKQTIQLGGAAAAQSINISFVFDANGSTDYFQVFGANQTTATDDISGAAITTFFGGSRVGGF